MNQTFNCVFIWEEELRITTGVNAEGCYHRFPTKFYWPEHTYMPVSWSLDVYSASLSFNPVFTDCQVK